MIANGGGGAALMSRRGRGAGFTTGPVGFRGGPGKTGAAAALGVTTTAPGLSPGRAKEGLRETRRLIPAPCDTRAGPAWFNDGPDLRPRPAALPPLMPVQVGGVVEAPDEPVLPGDHQPGDGAVV